MPIRVNVKEYIEETVLSFFYVISSFTSSYFSILNSKFQFSNTMSLQVNQAVPQPLYDAEYHHYLQAQGLFDKMKYV